MKRRLVFTATVATILFASAAFGQANLKVIAFYPKFCETTTGSAYYAIEPNDINWRGIDYVVHFWNTENVQTTTPPYFTLITSANDSIDAEYNGITNPKSGPSSWLPYQRQIIDSVHAVGGKVLLDIHQVNCEAFLAILPDSSKTEIFTYNVVQYLKRKGYDGVCINIEGWINNQGIPPASQLSRLTRRFRYWLNQMPSRGVLSYAPSMYDYDAYVASLDTAVDFYVVQGNYAQAWDGTLGSNANWFYQPLRKPNLCPNAGTSSWAGFLPNWINFGHLASKLAPIITTGGMVNIGSNQLCGKISNQESDGGYAVYDWLVSHGGTLNWNDVAKQHYITGTATASAYFGSNVTINSGDQFFACPEDSASIYAKVVWMDSLGYFGASCYSFGTDADFTKPRGKKNVVIAKTVEIVAATNSPPIPPSAPTLSTPSNGATNVATTPTLSWNAASGAGSYRVQVSTSSGFTTTIVNQGGITGTSYAVSSLIYSTPYYWRVNATNGGGTSAYSTTWSFATAAPPPPPSTPTLSSPSDGATGISRNPTLSWNAATGAASYQLQVSTSSSFSTTVVNQSGITLTSYAVSGLTNSTTYYWRVNATNGGGTSAYSTSWSFATAAPPPPPSTPTLSSPSDGATAVSLSPTLNWNAASGAASYQLQVSTSSGFSTTVVNQSGITTTSYVASGLSGTATYYWRVNATNDGGTSAYSTTWSFTTAAAPSGLVAAYSFNEGAGTTVSDASGQGNNATTSGAGWTTQGKYGGALSFNGSSGYVDLGNPTSLQITGSLTWSAWVKAAADPSDDGQIMAKSDDNSGWQLKTSPDTGPQTFGIAVTASGGSRVQRYSTTVRSLNTWYHVAGVYNAATQTLNIYVNAVLDNGTLSGTVPSSQTNSGTNVNIGRRSPGSWGGFYFNGIIDEVRVYNRALTQAEIQTDMNTPIGGTLSAPPTPTLNSPLNSAVGISTAPTLTWNASSGATSYQVQVSTSSSFTTTVVNQSGITSTSYAVSGLINNTVYYWRVNAKNSAGTSAYSTTWNLTTAAALQPPTAPVLATPANGATGVATNPTLTWNASTGATTYRVQVSTSSTFRTTVLNDSTITGTSRQVTSLTSGTTYYWRVNAKNSAGTSAYSTTWSLTTAAAPQPPAAPVLATPANGATGVATNPTLTWNASAGAATYRVQVSTSSTFGTTVLNDSTITGTSRQVTSLTSGTTYYWRVNAKNSAGTSAYSTTWSLTTAAAPQPPAAPVVATPANGATGVATNPTLTWNASTGATSYRVQVSANSGFTTTLVDQSGITTISLVISSLSPNTLYFWRVNATNSGGTSAYSATSTFTTMATLAGLIASYAFNEGTGTTVANASGNGLTGTISGASWTTSGKYNGALSFNGTSSYVDLGNPASVNITGSMTWSAWVNAAANPPDDGQIIAKSNTTGGWQLKTSPDTGPHTFAIAVSTNSSSHTQRYSTTVRSLNTWYHVAGVYNTSARTLDIYVNGVLDNGTLVGTIPASQFNSSLNVNIGRRSGGYYFNGIIDEVHVYDRALSQAEIQTDMNTSSVSSSLKTTAQSNGDILATISEKMVPQKYSLDQNYPNPFNPSTTISYAVPSEGHVRLQVFNILGELVATLEDRDVMPGYYRTTFDGGRLASGVYVYCIQAGDFVASKKLLLLK